MKMLNARVFARQSVLHKTLHVAFVACCIKKLPAKF